MTRALDSLIGENLADSPYEELRKENEKLKKEIQELKDEVLNARELFEYLDEKSTATD